MDSSANAKKADGLVVLLLCCLLCLGTLLVVGYALFYSDYGLDLTDEGLYLNWIVDPFQYPSSVSLFGFVYHPLFLFLEGDVTAIRQINVLVTFMLSTALAFAIIRSTVKQTLVELALRASIAAAIGTLGLLVFHLWLVTPNYNTLALQALLLTAVGISIVFSPSKWVSNLGGALVGAGGWVAFMAKPTTAAVLATILVAYLLASGQRKLRPVLWCIATGLCVATATAFAIDGSIGNMITRYASGKELVDLLDAGHSVAGSIRIDSFDLDDRTLIGLLCMVAALAWAAIRLTKSEASFQRDTLMVCGAFFTIALLATLVHEHFPIGPFQPLIALGFPLSLALTAWQLHRKELFSGVTRQDFSNAALFLTIPHVFAFGTISNYWYQGSSAAIFWLFAGLALLGPVLRKAAGARVILPVAFAALAVTALVMQSAYQNPYRQPQPLAGNATRVDGGEVGMTPLLSRDIAVYLQNAIQTADKAGLTAGTPIIDLSGRLPGLVFLLNARSLGQAWLIGGYSGSLNLAAGSLALTSCEEIAQAWLLVEPDGPRSIPMDLISTYGADFVSDYRLVGSWVSAEGAGGSPDKHVQQLYRPNDPKHINKLCSSLRQGT